MRELLEGGNYKRHLILFSEILGVRELLEGGNSSLLYGNHSLFKIWNKWFIKAIFRYPTLLFFGEAGGLFLLGQDGGKKAEKPQFDKNVRIDQFSKSVWNLFLY